MTDFGATGSSTKEPTEQRSIQSIEVGFRLIHVLERADQKLPLKTLSARADMPSSKAHLYLVSFMRLGLVVQDTATLQYGLGPYALQLGISALRQISLPEVARAPLERLHLEFELPTYLSLWAKMGPFIALKFDAELPTPFTIKVGYVFPLLTTATGRIFLAHLPNRDTDVLVRREGKIHPDMLAKREAIVAGVRADGIAVSEGALFRGFSALSAPIYDHSHDLAGSVTLLGMGDQVDAMIGGTMVQQVRKTAKEISRAMGATN